MAWSPTGLAAADLRGAVASLDEALGLWRGTPYVELEEAPAAVAERARLEELRSVALEDRAVAALALGDHATVAAELESLTARYPLRERLWGLRALALARAGRQADALEAATASCCSSSRRGPGRRRASRPSPRSPASRASASRGSPPSSRATP